MNKILTIIAASLAASSICLNAGAQEEDRTVVNDDAPVEEPLKSGLSFHLTGGAYYNSNVAVSALDVNIGNGDVSTKLSARAKYEKELNANTEFSLQYKISTTTHEKFSRFDLATHLVSVKLDHDFGDFKMGVSYQFADSNLNQNDFLTLNQISPYISKYLNKKTYFRGYYGYVDKQFTSAPTRNANVHKAGGDVYFFLDGIRQYIQTGYSYEDSNASSDEFDYGGHKLKIRYIKRIPFLNRQARFKAGWRYEIRNYSNITPSILEKRNDNRHRFELELELPITDIFYGQFELGHAIYSSNLASADYDRSIVAVSLGAKF